MLRATRWPNPLTTSAILVKGEIHMEEQRTEATEVGTSEETAGQSDGLQSLLQTRTREKQAEVSGWITLAIFGGFLYYVLIWQRLPEEITVRWVITGSLALAAIMLFIFMRARRIRFYEILGNGIILLVVVVGVVACSVLLAADDQSRIFKMFAIFYFSLLPPWLYLQFISTKGKTLWDEYVLNLYRLHVDDYAYLPEPPSRSLFHRKWAAARKSRIDRGEKVGESIYKKKFEGLFGTAPMESSATFAIFRGENLWPVVVATVAIAVGWVLVVRPDTIYGFTILPAGTRPSGELEIPLETLRFAFLGAYFYILQMLVRRYFQNDLKTSAYVNATVRIVVVMLLVWAVDILLPQTFSHSQRLGAAFVIGVFPHVGLQAVQALVKLPLKLVIPSLRQQYPLSDLDGLNIWYESRLLEEGVEDMQNLATANLVDVMLNTRIPIERLVDWVDQSLLYLHLGREGRRLKGGEVSARDKLRRYSVRTATDLEDIFKARGAFEHRKEGRDKFLKDFESILNDKDEEPSRVLSILASFKNEPNLYHVRKWKEFAADYLEETDRPSEPDRPPRDDHPVQVLSKGA
jgi:hypothetical protein